MCIRDRTKIGLEACGAAHYWARELEALAHEVVLLPPQYVKPYVKRSKSDAADAEAICEAMSRPSMRFVPVKSADQQALQMLAKLRAQFIGRRTQLANSMRGFAAEFGYVAPKGLARLGDLLADIRIDATMPNMAREMFETLVRDDARIDEEIAALDGKLLALHRSNEVSRRLAAIPGIGPIGATLLAIKVTDAHGFGCGRDFALARADAEEPFDGGQEPVGRHHPRRRRDVACRAGCGRDGGHPAHAAHRQTGLALARGPDCAQAGQAGGGGLGQQAGAYRMEADGRRRGLSPHRHRRAGGDVGKAVKNSSASDVGARCR